MTVLETIRARAGAFLSGCHAKRTEGADLYLGITADQIAAKTLGKDNLLPSLELKLDDSDLDPLCDEGYTCAYMNTFSWSSATTPLPMENNPRLVFQRLFGEGENVKDRLTQTRRRPEHSGRRHRVYEAPGKHSRTGRPQESGSVFDFDS